MGVVVVVVVGSGWNSLVSNVSKKRERPRVL